MTITNSTTKPTKPPVIIREGKISDGKALNAYIRTIFETTDHLITRPSEFKMGAWRQRRWIAQKLMDPVETCLVALADGEIVGMLDNWTDKRGRVTHATCFSMSVKKGWRCKGVGADLLGHFIQWVKAHKRLTRIELHVHSDNKHALALYKKVGFELEGTRKKAVFYEDGRVVDDHIMAFWP